MNLPNDIAPILRHSITATLRCFILHYFVAAVVLAPIASGAATLRIGYQKAATTLVLLKAHGTLEKKLAPLNIEVKWLEFAAGPQLLEGLNLGSIDFGYVGEVPPIFALAAGAPLVYTAYELPTPEAEGILVPKDSPIRTIADLRGKKIAFNKGSDVHWLVVKALEDAGLKYSDVQPTYLAPADARAAFQNGAIDAWARLGNGCGTITRKPQKNWRRFKGSSPTLSRRVSGTTNTFISQSTLLCWQTNKESPI